MNGLPRRVRKRDGREVPFALRKIVEAIEGALRTSIGESPRGLAEELAGAVALSLARLAPPQSRSRQLRMDGSERNVEEGAPGVEARSGSSHPSSRGAGNVDYVPTVEQIDNLVERVLRETGRHATAEAYIARRSQRAEAREQIEILQDPSFSSAAPGLNRERETNPSETPFTASATRKEPWSKGKIVAALMMEAELPRQLAEDVAAKVEARVFSAGLRRISTGLLRELVDNELFSRGLEVHLHRQSTVGIPKHDLREGLRSGFFRDTMNSSALVAWTGTPEASVARAVFTRFSIEEVLPARLADRHLAGDLHFDNLEAPYMDRTGVLSLRSFVAGDFPFLSEFPRDCGWSESLDQLASFMARARRVIAGDIVLTDVDVFLKVHGKGLRRNRLDEVVDDLIRTLLLRTDGSEITLSLPAESPNLSMIAASISRLRTRYPVATGSLKLFIFARSKRFEDAPHALDAIRPSLENAPGPVPRFGFADDAALCVAPGARVFTGAESAPFASTGAAAVLNLAKLCYGIPAWSEGRLLEQVARVVDDAVAGLEAIQTVLRETTVSRPRDFTTPRRAFAISYSGLRECVRLMNDGAIELQTARTVVQTIVERAFAVSRSRGLRVFVEPWYPSAARQRFERIDSEQQVRARIFSDGDRVRYSEGATLSPVAGIGPGVAESEVLLGIPAFATPAFSNFIELWDFVAATVRHQSRQVRGNVPESRGGQTGRGFEGESDHNAPTREENG